MDGVYSLYSPKYGVEVIADGERLEVKSPQFIFRKLKESRPQPEQMPIIKEHRGEICFSKNLIRICSRSHPKEVGSKQVGFVCISGPQAEIFKRRVLAGDLVEEFEYFPTKFVKTVYEPRQC